VTTVQGWIDRARVYLQGSQADAVNRLDADYYPGDSEIILKYPLEGVGRGAPISVGRACFMAWSADAAAKTIEVTPGWAGASDVAVPSGSIVRVKPKFFDHHLYDALEETLAELSSPERGLFGVDQIEIEYLSPQTVYDLIDADGFLAPISVAFAEPTDSTDRWPFLRANEYDIRTIQPTAEFPSGLQLKLHVAPSITEGETIVLTYKKALIMPGDLDSSIESCGLDESAYDLPPMGAAVRLAFPQEMRRNSTSSQGDTRRADEVPAGANLGASRALLALYERRVNQEYARLVRAYSIRER
jgi:hypothetical protein